jgi:cytochrome c oxidase cbb3-type subunit 3
MLCSGCDLSHGKPGKDSETLAPDQIMDFATLYSQNCAGCHGTEGRGGAAIALADPVYLAIADDAAVRKVTANGVLGTSMPAFAQSAGGMLTDKQIDVITGGIRRRWSKPGILESANPPSYSAKSARNVAQGAATFKSYCESCHGEGGRGGPKGSAIANDAFLELVSDQGLRTVIITGRPELGAPDWRGDVPGKPMSEQEITDVVAWLISQRTKSAPQLGSASNYAQH